MSKGHCCFFALPWKGTPSPCAEAGLCGELSAASWHAAISAHLADVQHTPEALRVLLCQQHQAPHDALLACRPHGGQDGLHGRPRLQQLLQGAVARNPWPLLSTLCMHLSCHIKLSGHHG